MKVHIRLKRTDFLEKKEEVIADTDALLNENRLLYAEKDGKTKQRVTFNEDNVVLDRDGRYGSRITLPKQGTGDCLVYSPYGTMSLDAELCYFEKNEDDWQIEYKISQEEQLVTHVKLEWEIAKN